MTLIVSALTVGVILALMSIGVFITFRIFRFMDLTTDGSFTLGASISGALILAGVHPLLATVAAAGGGALAGMLTGVLHARLNINNTLAGIIVMIALYSINLHIMSGAQISLYGHETLMSYADSIAVSVFGGEMTDSAFGGGVTNRALVMLCGGLATLAFCIWLLYAFFKTRLGLAMRAAGANQSMVKALGVNVNVMVILGLGLANAFIALSGSLFAQESLFATVDMGVGMIAAGLASVIVGETVLPKRSFGLYLLAAATGTFIYRIAIQIALWLEVPPGDLRLMTAAFLVVALTLPILTRKFRSRKPEAETI